MRRPHRSAVTSPSSSSVLAERASLVYLDYAATTPVDRRVLEQMLPYFTEKFWNPGSPNECGKIASDAVALARQQVADTIGVASSRIIFTAGASEANNLAFAGLACKQKSGHFVTTNIEHKSVLEPLYHLKRNGYRLTVVPVRSNGIVDPSDIEAALEPDTILVSVMAVNNEIGTIQPIEKIGALCKSKGVLFHSDATQAFGKIPIKASPDLMSLSSHKIYGPKGVGALYRARAVPIECQIRGGGQESGLRAGTLNVSGIVGLGVASDLGKASAEKEWTRLTTLGKRLRDGLDRELDGVVLNGDLDQRVPWILSFSFPGADATDLCKNLGLCMGRGSACSKLSDMSHVLRALGLSEALCTSTVRISLGRLTTDHDVDTAVQRISDRLREKKLNA